MVDIRLVNKLNAQLEQFMQENNVHVRSYKQFDRDIAESNNDASNIRNNPHRTPEEVRLLRNAMAIGVTHYVLWRKYLKEQANLTIDKLDGYGVPLPGLRGYDENLDKYNNMIRPVLNSEEFAIGLEIDLMNKHYQKKNIPAHLLGIIGFLYVYAGSRYIYCLKKKIPFILSNLYKKLLVVSVPVLLGVIGFLKYYSLDSTLKRHKDYARHQKEYSVMRQNESLLLARDILKRYEIPHYLK